MKIDPRLSVAISEQVEHSAPFSAQELASVDYLDIRHAYGLAGIEACRALEILVMIGCEIRAFPELGGLAKLATVEISVSGITDISAVSELPQLLRLGLEMNMVQDLSPLLECQRLRRVDVTGNPLSEESYRQLIPDLRARGVRIAASEEVEWELTLALHAAGLPMSYYRRGGNFLLSRPGLKLTAQPEAGHIKVNPGDLRRMLMNDPSEIEPLFQRKDLMLGFWD